MFGFRQMPLRAVSALWIGTFGCRASDADDASSLTVQEGKVTAFMIEDCAALDTCFGNNPDSPYLLFNVPPHPDHGDAVPVSELGVIPRVPEGMSAATYLDENEALLIRGRLPPSAAYLGLTPYLFSRPDESGHGVNVFASLGDSLNHVNLSTQGATVFDADVAIIMTSDSDTLAAARESLETDGFAPEAINEVLLPRDVLHQGLTELDDTVQLLGRIALFEDAAAGADYLADIPMTVSRLTPTDGHVGPAVSVPDRTPRGNGETEAHLEDALDALDDAIMASLEGVTHERVSVLSSRLISQVIDPELCLDQVTECLGDNGDTTYAAGPIDVARGDGVLRLGPDGAFVVFGVNHQAAGKAEYSNLSVYSGDKQMGVVSLNNHEMTGTADRYLPGHPDRDQLFVTEVRRDCSGREGCLVLPTGFPGIAPDEDLFFIFRAYVNPGKSVSPGHDELLTERVVFIPGLP